MRSFFTSFFFVYCLKAMIDSRPKDTGFYHLKTFLLQSYRAVSRGYVVTLKFRFRGSVCAFFDLVYGVETFIYIFTA